MSTYSIVGYDPNSEELGVAVQSRFLAVGALVPWVMANVGAVATQAKTNVHYGVKVLQKLQEGQDVNSVVAEVIQEDADYQRRQIGILNAQGQGAAFTGKACLPWAGHRVGANFCCQGNCLSGPAVLDAMADAYARTEGDLAYKLLQALEAAQYYGGDRRGQQSAALLVKGPKMQSIGNTDKLVDLRIDDHHQPVEELNRLLQLHRVVYSHNHCDRYFPFQHYLERYLLGMLKQIGFYDRHFRSYVECRQVILRFAETYGFPVQEVFYNGSINGAVVDLIVSQYYDKEDKENSIPPIVSVRSEGFEKGSL